MFDSDGSYHPRPRPSSQGFPVAPEPNGRLLLIDTGSNYTVVPNELLEAIGCSPAASHDHVRIMTANGVVILPRTRRTFFLAA
jgi:hypothetical protein